MKSILNAAKTILFPLLVGLLSGVLISGNVDSYEVFIKPPFSLPGNLFGIVWTILFILMGVSLFLFKRSDANEAELSEGKLYFFIQLILNFLWPIVFFNFKLPFAAFLLLIALFIFTLITTVKFYNADKISGILLLPYLFYIVYAGYLNFAIWYLNM